MSFLALRKFVGFLLGAAIISASLVGTVGTAQAITPHTLDGSATGSISGSISWQAITGGGSETPTPRVQLDTTGDDANGGSEAIVATQMPTGTTYDFEGLPPGSYVVKVTDFIPNGAPTSYYPTTYYGGEYNYQDATPIVLASGQASSGNDIHMLVGATVTGTITGSGGALLPNVEDLMFPTTGAGASLDNSSNDSVTTGGARLDEEKGGGSDASGDVVIRGIAPDTYAFRYAGDDTYSIGGEYAPSYWKNATFALDASTLTVKLGHTYTVNQRLSLASYIGGSVTDKAGTIIRGGYVALYNAEEPTDDAAGLVHVGQILPSGNWSFNLLGPGTYKVGFTQAANGVTPTGALAASYPFVSSWYGGSSYSTATDIVITAGHSNWNVNGVMPYDESFLDNWVAEQSGGSNASEPYCQCFSGDPVNDATGEFYLDSLTDLSLPGVGPAVSLARSYSSSNSATAGPFGYGWSSGLSSSLSVITPSTTGGPPQVVQITQENGATVRFTLDVNGVYEAPPRVLASLVLNPDGSWTFIRRATTAMNFTSSGQLTSVADLHGNTVTYAYNSSGQVSTISGSGGRQISLIWDGNNITGATDSAGRSVGFGYDSAGDLTAVTDADGNTSTYSYDGNHLLLTAVKPDGGATTNVYDSSGRVISQTDAAGRTTSWAYSGDDADETTSVTAPDGAVHSEHYLNLILASSTVAVGTPYAATTSYQYDEALEVLTKTDPLNKSTTYTWDQNGNKLSETTPLDRTTTWTYDSLNDLTSTSDPVGNSTSETYDATGDLLDSSDALGDLTSFSYNHDGTVATRTTPNGGTYRYGYDAAGQLTSVEDPLGATTTSAYNSAGFLTSSTDALSNVTSETVDAEGHVLTTTDALGNVATYSYDGDGNRTTSTDPEGHVSTTTYDAADEKTASTNPDGDTTSYSYGANGLLASTTTPVGGKTRYYYNAAEEKRETVNPVGDKTRYLYDRDGRLRETIAPGGGETTTAYDADGNAVSVTDPDGNTTLATFDADERPVTSTDPLGRITATTYTANGKVARVTKPDGSAESWVYDADGNVRKLTNADGQVATYAYDADDRQTRANQPGGLVTLSAYDADGRLLRTTKPDGSHITMGYDADGHLTSSRPSTSGAAPTTYRYTADGERHSMGDSTGTTVYSYDAAGRERVVTSGAGQKVEYAYDKAGDVTKLTYPSGNAVTYAFNRAGQMISAEDWNGNITTFTWTPDGKLATQTGGDGVTETRVYDAAGNTTQISDATTSSTLASYGYGYDAAGQLTSDSATDPDVTDLDHTYTYDALGQISSASDGTTTTPYSATSGGELTASAANPAATYNPAGELTSSTSASGAAVTYGYDANGDRTSTSSTTGSVTSLTNYSYDAYGNLASASLPDGSAVSYTSNGDGLRQSETVGGTTNQFVWDTQASLALLLDDGTHSYIYGPSATPIAQESDAGPTVQYLHSDLVGSVRLITNSSGSAVGTTEYDPYGNVASHTGSADSAMGFTGALTDLTTGLLYLRARDYDATTGQFVSQDPLLQLTNQLYEYASNSPLLMTDLTGLWDWGLTLGIAGIVIGVAALTVLTFGVGDVVIAGAVTVGDAIDVAGTAVSVASEVVDCSSNPASLSCDLDQAGVGLSGIGDIGDLLHASTLFGGVVGVLGLGDSIAGLIPWNSGAGSAPPIKC